jgi:hypothetical protein
MYYDLIASLPYLPHFEQAPRLPISPLRLKQRLVRLEPEHAEQLERARSITRWRPPRLLHTTDAKMAADYSRLMDSISEKPLREYIALRMEQQTLLAALRRKRDGLPLPEGAGTWGVGPRLHWIRRHWETPDFGLRYVFPWLPEARELMTAGDARVLERLLMDGAWRWLSQRAEQDMFAFAAVSSYVLKWDILRSWLAGDADQAKNRFALLIDQVTHAEPN